MENKSLSWDEAPMILTTKQVSELLELSVGVIRKRCSKKEIPAAKFGRLWRIDKQKLIESMK